MVRKAVVFDESSSEDEKELVGELQRADQRERARNPHSHEGKAKMPRSRIIQPSSSSGGDVAPAKKRNLFDDSSSSDDDAPTTTSVVRTTRKKVLGEDGDGEDHHEEDEDGVVRINDAYATKFEAIKRKQELHRLTEKYGKRLKSVAGKHGSDEEDEDESGDDAEEDDDAMLLTPEHELAFAKALLAVRKAAVHGTSTADVKEVEEPYLMQRYFPSAEEQTRHNTEVFEKMVEARRHKKTANAAGFTLKDEYERKLTSLATGAEDEKEEAQVGDGSGTRRLRPQTAEERKLREAFLKGVEGDENEEDDGKFIIKPSKKAGTSATTSSTAAAENDDELRDEQVRLLEEAFSLTGGASSSPAAVDGEAPREDQETFIRNFFVKELWRGAEGDDDDDAEGGGGHYNLAQLAQEEADEAFFNDAEVWEREYQDKQFRHEEDGEDVEHVQTFARPIGEAAAGLLRRPDTSRKDARQRRLDRAEEQRQQQLEELKRLKHLKRQEIDEQRALIAAVAGLVGGPRGKHAQAGGDASSSSTSARRGGSDALEKRLQAVWSEHDLDADFNAEEFDRKMASLFNDEFYDDEMVDEDEMAFFEQELDGEGDEDDEAMDIATMRAALAKDPDLFNAASLEEAQQMAAASGTTTSSKKKKGGDVEDGEDPFFSDEFSKLLGGGFDGLGEEAGGRHTSTHTADVLYPDAPAMPGATQADTHKATMDQLQHDLKRKEEEYDRLHYASGSVEGSGLSHFKYREVPAEDFTLSLEEILARDDRQLNMIAPMRCYAAYMDAHSNRRDRGRIERKRTKGFREMDSQRSSRRYGEVERTAVLDSSLSEEKGMEIVANLRKRLREVGEGPTQPFKKPKQQQQQQHPHLHNRRPQAPSHSHHEPPQRPRFPKKKP